MKNSVKKTNRRHKMLAISALLFLSLVVVNAWGFAVKVNSVNLDQACTCEIVARGHGGTSRSEELFSNRAPEVLETEFAGQFGIGKTDVYLDIVRVPVSDYSLEFGRTPEFDRGGNHDTQWRNIGRHDLEGWRDFLLGDCINGCSNESRWNESGLAEWIEYEWFGYKS